MDAKEIDQLHFVINEVKRLTNLPAEFQDKLENACRKPEIIIVKDYAIGDDLYKTLENNGTNQSFLKAEDAAVSKNLFFFN